ncbi:hypothetical protein [Mycobacterium noviomagense]|uniref:Exported alanine and valine rich protein n=1 Tax=Mycobacterium noviomagense TaxID=459858 RepID=A0A7I7PHW4_9MYCO|nr:hypothetical protein [Mycobacterium noviomagense]ORB16803.1 hypothetical protein BST37_05795 [Mycobacterium noviomagense]BBY08151.1 hypothetical protein MNVI_34690 [Mycobacterium noviomagense]
MRRWLLVLVTFVAGAVIAAPRASAGAAPIGRLGDTLRVDTGKIVADVTVSPVEPPTPVRMASDFTFDGVTPFADAYTSRASDAPDALDTALLNAPPGATVHGGVYWDAYRDPVSNVVLLDRKTVVHLAQWNL